MQNTRPGETTITSFPGLPTGVLVGVQVIKATTGTVAVGRFTLGVAERPAGSGNYVAIYSAPADGDIYLVVADWSGGTLTPETTSIIELKVSTEVQPGDSGLGAIADYAKMHLGGETWKALLDSDNFGAADLTQGINVIKTRAMATPPDTAGESALDPRVLDYLGMLVAIALIPAARDYWGSQQISLTRGDDSSETVTYANRTTMMNALRDDLMRDLPAVRMAALPFMDSPPVEASADGPVIDEDDDCGHVTKDPRRFPRESTFPYHHRFPVDIFGQRTGVRL